MNALLLTEHQKTQWTGRTKIYKTKMMDDDYDKHYKLSTSLNTDSVMDNFVFACLTFSGSSSAFPANFLLNWYVIIVVLITLLFSL